VIGELEEYLARRRTHKEDMIFEAIGRNMLPPMTKYCLKLLEIGGSVCDMGLAAKSGARF
jgi:hypothetical protein